ncbi:hypothetical protein GR11A_00181 [Vibrio phage vB_VcorM_GR11A]|nr:hypothetical protein GR11A_00181 [Vibrio phage vB_VcorM_GR11A]
MKLQTLLALDTDSIRTIDAELAKERNLTQQRLDKFKAELATQLKEAMTMDEVRDVLESATAEVKECRFSGQYSSVREQQFWLEESHMDEELESEDLLFDMLPTDEGFADIDEASTLLH